MKWLTDILDLRKENQLLKKQLQAQQIYLERLAHLDSTLKEMCSPYAETPEWTNDDEIALRHFFNTDLGKRFLIQLLNVCETNARRALVNTDGGLNRFSFGQQHLFHQMLMMAKIFISEMSWSKDGGAMRFVPKFTVSQSASDVTEAQEEDGSMWGRYKSIWKIK